MCCAAIAEKGRGTDMDVRNSRDALEDNYLALCIAIVYPYGIDCEEAWRALHGKLEEPLVAAGVLQDAAAILKDKKRKLERLRSVLNEENYGKAIFLQQVLLFYEQSEVYQTAGREKFIPCVQCRYAGSRTCWREFVKFMGCGGKQVKGCQFGEKKKF